MLRLHRKQHTIASQVDTPFETLPRESFAIPASFGQRSGEVTRVRSPSIAPASGTGIRPTYTAGRRGSVAMCCARSSCTNRPTYRPMHTSAKRTTCTPIFSIWAIAFFRSAVEPRRGSVSSDGLSRSWPPRFQPTSCNVADPVAASSATRLGRSTYRVRRSSSEEVDLQLLPRMNVTRPQRHGQRPIPGREPAFVNV